MKKRYYFNKSVGMLGVISLLFFILPLAIVIIGFCLLGFFGGVSILIFEDVDIAFRLIVILMIVMAAPTITVVIFFIRYLSKEIYLCLNTIEIDDKGITTYFFNKVKKQWSWHEIEECDFGWEFNIRSRNYKPLPEGKEQFAFDWGRYKEKYGIKYIYFSKKRITETERMEIFGGQLKKDYLIAVKYTKTLAEYLELTERFTDRSTEMSNGSYGREQLQDRYIKQNKNIKFKQFADSAEGISSLMGCIFCLFWIILGIVAIYSSTNRSIASYNIAEWALMFFIGIVVPCIFEVFSVRYMSWFLRVITVDDKGVEAKFLFVRGKRWNWDEVKECGVIRNNSIHRGDGGARNQRYIFFSEKPFYLNENMRFQKQIRRNDVIFITYSERLYCYLCLLGVIDKI